MFLLSLTITYKTIKIMKKFFSMSVVLAVMALFCVSCTDTMDDKSDVENGFTKYAVPAMGIAVDVESYSSAAVHLTADKVEGVLEQGVYMVDVKDGEDIFVAADSVAEKCEMLVDCFEELSTYEVFPYVMMKSGNIVKGDKSVKITTPKMPVFTVEGEYVVTEWEYDWDIDDYVKEADTYPMTITFTSGNEEEGGTVSIYNLWGSKKYITGTFDPETKSITIPKDQVIDEDADYGNMWIAGETEDGNIVLDLDGITFNSCEWSVNVELGTWGYYMVEMKRDLK